MPDKCPTCFSYERCERLWTFDGGVGCDQPCWDPEWRSPDAELVPFPEQQRREAIALLMKLQEVGNA